MKEISLRKDPVIWGEYGDVAVPIQPRFTRPQTVQSTSLDALPAAGLTHRQTEALTLQLLDTHPHAPLTTYELAALLGKPVNCLTQPVKTLREQGAIILAGRKRNPTGAFADSWITPRHSRELAHRE